MHAHSLTPVKPPLARSTFSRSLPHTLIAHCAPYPFLLSFSLHSRKKDLAHLILRAGAQEDVRETQPLSSSEDHAQCLNLQKQSSFGQ